MDGYRDFFSQGASSSAGPSFRQPHGVPNHDELELLSQWPEQPRTAPTVSAGRVGMENLDLNSQQ
ncbi:uncharacterized protein C2845_PM07G28770 [Panicum miliaceum]|uniref:Uncharacterized protein n=1 Tax=Panicum miliaceum TaxID=4540 RepID=A0A3L6SVF0_PANMI|nr:uncharacterized protein C2845_PM07G28770 [Panicum miliaceum]